MIAAILPQEHNEEAQHPYIPEQVKTLDKFRTMLVDSGSCYNVISLELFNTLANVELVPNNLPAQGITGHTRLFLGRSFLKLKVGQLICSDHFYVMPPKAMILSIILGTPWQRKYKVVPDWETNSIKIKLKDGYIRQPFISPKAQIDSTKQTREVLHKGKEFVLPSSVKWPPTQLTASTSSSTPTSTKRKLVWRPKQQQPTPQRTHTTQTSTFPQVSSTQRYVPKKLLEAQRGQRKKWIPKQLHKTTPSTLKPKEQPQPNQRIPPIQSRSFTQKWVSKIKSKVPKVPKPKPTLV